MIVTVRAALDTKILPPTYRFWAVAVDVLGQEGFPSAPVLHNRQYRKAYETFVGDRHR